MLPASTTDLVGVNAAPVASPVAPVRRTQAEINDLVTDWKSDPHWDLETTEGFEFHHDELLAISAEQKKRWADEREREYAKKAEELGVPGNLALARYVSTLEYRLEKLEAKTRDL